MQLNEGLISKRKLIYQSKYQSNISIKKYPYPVDIRWMSGQCEKILQNILRVNAQRGHKWTQHWSLHEFCLFYYLYCDSISKRDTIGISRKVVKCKYIWVRSRNCGCRVTWFCYQLIAKPGNKTVTVPWPDPYEYMHISGETAVTQRINSFWFRDVI